MTNNAVWKMENSKVRQRVDRQPFQITLTWWNLSAAAGLAGGILAGFVGLTLTAIAWFSGVDATYSNLGLTGIWFTVASFPLMTFGACCLDKIETITKAQRIQYCKNHGLSDEQGANLDEK